MGSLGQVEGVQMESRQETPAALTALGEGRERRVTEERAYCIYFSLVEKARTYVKKSSRGKKREELQRQLGFNLGIQLSWRIPLFSKKMAGLKAKKTLS